MKVSKANSILKKKYGGRVHAEERDGCIYVSGSLDKWEDIIDACQTCATRYSKVHVVNDIKFTGAEIPKIREPEIEDKALEGITPDVLVIGGGITGASVLRELMKWKVSALLVEKEPDLALQASGRNDGQVHPGVDLGNGNLKHDYVIPGNRMYGELCKELGVPFKRDGQYGSTVESWAGPLLRLNVFYRKKICHVDDTQYIKGDKLYELGPNLKPGFKFGMYNPAAGVTCPYGLTIAYGENAIANGAKISLNTVVRDMKVKDGVIESVETNRGTIYPKLVINAAGTFAEDIAIMAEDRFFSIHPRRGTNSILDKKTGSLIKGITSVKAITNKTGAKNTKGGGIIHTAHDNLLIGPDAVETYEKENFATNQESIDTVFNTQQKATDVIKQKDIITYFTGVRAATFEEDFILERGRKTNNIIHMAGIQSPGLTAAPAFSKDMAKLAVDILRENGEVLENENFNGVRKPIPVLKDLPDEERDRLIKENPDYGIIICRCEEISKGEIIDALKSPLCVPTVDGVKKRVRPGMGRCQGGFCMPQVVKIISEFTGVSEDEITKSGSKSFISYGKIFK